MRLPAPLIRLYERFDHRQMAQEIARLDESLWMPHPGQLAGNAAIPLVSQHGQYNDEFAGPMATTEALGQLPYIRQVIACFNEMIGRSRLMRLSAGARIPRHVDFNNYWHDRVRMHIPITTTAEVSFFCAGQQVFMAAGECWLLDNWRRHGVENSGPADRVHLVIDLAGSAQFWQRVETQLEDRGPVPAVADRPLSAVWTPTYEPQVICESLPAESVMNPGTLEPLVLETIADFSAREDNPAALTSQYRQALMDFARDWRVTWLNFGNSTAGMTTYRELARRLRDSLSDEPTALKMSSNGVGVNPVIVQRIIRGALPEAEI